MKSEIIKLDKDFLSRQNNSKGEPVIDLKKNDIVELREDGIYYTRKIDLEYFDGQRQWNFEHIKERSINP